MLMQKTTEEKKPSKYMFFKQKLEKETRDPL